MRVWNRGGFLLQASEYQMACLKSWKFWKFDRFLNHPWIMDASKSSLRRCNQLTTGQLQVNIAFIRVISQGIGTKEWQPHGCKSSLGGQRHVPSQNQQVLWWCPSNQSTNSEASNLCEIFCGNASTPVLAGFGIGDFAPERVADCLFLTWDIFWGRIRGTQKLSKAVFHYRWPLSAYIDEFKITEYNRL